MSDVTVNELAVRRFFENQALGSSVLSGPDSSATRLARRIVTVAKRNASGDVVRARTGDLAESIQPIVRIHLSGALEVGVGSTSPYAGYLEDGTDGGYLIAPRRIDRMLVSAPGHPDPLRGPHRWVVHPGIEAKRFLRKAVDEVIRLGT